MVFDPKGPDKKSKAGFEHFPFAVSKNYSTDKVGVPVANSGEFRYYFLTAKKHRKGFSERCIRTPGRAL
jgi:hypothetical protein